ncbi:hypothetical protein [Bifidobacterium fermentum]|uniref:Metal ABC transporter permease n=1 Tax=Bifidobacterium fermentum TaxID=3059035 RepID=A0AB39UFH8_9BIFI
MEEITQIYGGLIAGALGALGVTALVLWLFLNDQAGTFGHLVVAVFTGAM